MNNDLLPVAAISDRHPRRAAFERIFGRLDRIPITEWLPTRAKLNGLVGPHEVHLLDLNRITPEEYGRLVDYIAETFNELPAEVRNGLAKEGFALLAEHLIVAIPLRLLI